MQVHNKTLSVNLEQHATVLEKLIGLNTELMDNLNAKSAYLLYTPPPLPPQTPAEVCLLVRSAQELCRESRPMCRNLSLSDHQLTFSLTAEVWSQDTIYATNSP